MWFFGKDKFERLINEKESAKRFNEEVRPELEKGDGLAIVIAALLVFMPIVLFAVGLLWLVGWLLG
jgi:hypothetical protein